MKIYSTLPTQRTFRMPENEFLPQSHAVLHSTYISGSDFVGLFGQIYGQLSVASNGGKGVD